MNVETMVRLLSHRGSLFIIKETWVKGDDKVCPRCKGSGRFDDCAMGDRGDDVRHAPSGLGVPQPGSICAVCEGRGRAQKRFVVQEVPHWYFQVTDEGVELSITLKREDIRIYFSEEEAQAGAIYRNLQERNEVITGVPGWFEM